MYFRNRIALAARIPGFRETYLHYGPQPATACRSPSVEQAGRDDEAQAVKDGIFKVSQLRIMADSPLFAGPPKGLRASWSVDCLASV
jgi:hypothetical protein